MDPSGQGPKIIWILLYRCCLKWSCLSKDQNDEWTTGEASKME